MFIRQSDMKGLRIGFGVNGDGLYPKLTASLDDPNRDFATIGHQYFFKHGRPFDLP
jgi:hypothetical protein